MTSINHHFATWNVCYSSIFTLQIIYVGFIKEKDKCYYRSILQKKCNDKFKLIIEKKTLINENVLWKYLSLSKYHQFRLHLKQIIFNENRYDNNDMNFIFVSMKNKCSDMKQFSLDPCSFVFPIQSRHLVGCSVIGYRL